MSAPVVTFEETRRDDKWIYGDRLVDGEFCCTWMQEIPATEKKQRRGYGLAEYEAEILVRDRHLADYFETMVFICEHPSIGLIWFASQLETVPAKFVSVAVEQLVEHIPTPAQCAKFLINEITAAAKRHKINTIDIPVAFVAILLLYRRAGLLDNKKLRIVIDDELGSRS